MPEPWPWPQPFEIWPELWPYGVVFLVVAIMAARALLAWLCPVDPLEDASEALDQAPTDDRLNP